MKDQFLDARQQNYMSVTTFGILSAFCRLNTPDLNHHWKPVLNNRWLDQCLRIWLMTGSKSTKNAGSVVKVSTFLFGDPILPN